MSLGACLPALEADGKIPPEQAAEARALYDEKIAEYTRSAGPEAAAALASADVLAALERQVTRKDFLAARTIKVRTRIAADLGGYGPSTGSGRAGGGGEGGSPPGGGGPLDPRAGPALIDHDPRARFSNVEGRRKAIVASAHRLLDRVLADHSTNLLGQVRHKAQLRNVVRELFGEATGDRAAGELAGAWRQAAEMLRRRFNAAGGEIGFRADWGLPQSHDWRTVRAAGFDAWREFILPRLDPAKMIDARTGQRFTRASLEEALPEIFDTIRSDGAGKAKPGGPRGKALANTRADPRFFVFRSADAWSEYAARFGSGSAYDAMMGHIEGMARDTAALEVLGPNPDATVRWVQDTLEQSAKLDRAPDSKAADRARSRAKRMAELWDEYRGLNLEPRHRGLATVGSGYRAVWTARKLGSAFLSAASDLAFTASRHRFNGLAQKTWLPKYLELMVPGSVEGQKMAIRRGLIADGLASRTAAQSRVLMEELTGEVPRRLAEGVLRLSGLLRHTRALQWANGMEWLATFTEAADKNFAALPPKLRDALGRYGMDAADWDKLRAAPMDHDGGADWISPHNLPAEDQELASRFSEMIHEERDLEVPTADLGTRSMYNRKAERGTLFGEFMRSGPLMARSFGIAVMYRQMQEIGAIGGSRGASVAARYAIGLMIGTTMMGAISLQMKEIAAGRDPRPMNDPDFWLAAMAQGGGWGIFGDLLKSAESREGHGLAVTAAGGVVQDAQDVVDISAAAVRHAVPGGKDGHPERKIVRVAKGWLPGNNLWYTRAAFDRMIADQIDELVNPDIRAARRRMERAAAEQGTGFYWRPGEGLPARAPDFANALEEGPEE